MLGAMTDTLAHRGPDDHGTEIVAGTGPVQTALGHRRLSIIDLDSGHQPMHSSDGRLVIIYNGELYNFMDLRRDLEAQGHTFQTRSDTEVLLAMYREHGELMLPHLNGMFSFVIWDNEQRLLFAARDRLGQKPFHYAWRNRTLIFGSEIKALLKHPLVSRDLDVDGLTSYLSMEYIPSPRTIFRDIHKLPGGHALRLVGGRLETWSYWPCPFGDADTEAGADSEDEACRRIVELLEDAVSSRLVSDVPLGLFLSGGIDSSAVLAMMARKVPARQIRTFAIGFKEKKYDESGYAREVARHFGTSHEEEILDPGRMLEILPSILKQQDEPFADPSIVPTYLLCQKTRRHVTVALGGDGGDELFAGYGFFGWHRWASRLAGITPGGLRRRLADWSRRQPRWLADTKAGYKLNRFLYALPLSPEVRQIFWMGAVYPLMHRDLWLESRDRQVDGVFDTLGHHAAACPSGDPWQRALHVYYQTYLQEDILAKVDRASMMHSLEVRAPFLDYRLVEYVSKLPMNYKLRNKTTKYILKKALTGLVPDHILHRRKKGFAVPLGKWFKDELSGELRETLSARRLGDAGLFDPACVTRMVEEHVSGRRDWRKPLWTLYVFEKWREEWSSSR